MEAFFWMEERDGFVFVPPLSHCAVYSLISMDVGASPSAEPAVRLL